MQSKQLHKHVFPVVSVALMLFVLSAVVVSANQLALEHNVSIGHVLAVRPYNVRPAANGFAHLTSPDQSAAASASVSSSPNFIGFETVGQSVAMHMELSEK
jgi:hypothetical protein